MDSNSTLIENTTGKASYFKFAIPVKDWKRANFYRRGFKVTMFAVNLQAIVIICIVSFITYKIYNAVPQHKFFAQNIENKSMQMYYLDLPNMSRSTLANWVSQAATEIMTFGFNDIDERFALSVQNFTENGWEGFREAMINSGIVDTLIEGQQIVTSAPKSVPVLAKEGMINGVYSWVFDMERLVTFRSGAVKKNVTKNLHLVVERVPTDYSVRGVGIAEWYMY